MGDFFNNFKELRLTPLWVLAGIAIACDIVVYYQPIRSDIPAEFILWLKLGAVFFNVLTITKLIDTAISFVRARNPESCSISFAPIQNRSYWHLAKQSDGRNLTQISIGFLATNLTTAPIGLSNPRILNSPIGLGREMLHLDVLIQSPNSKVFGSTEISKYALRPNVPQIVAIHGFFDRSPWFIKKGALRLSLEMTDTLGQKQLLTVHLKHA